MCGKWPYSVALFEVYVLFTLGRWVAVPSAKRHEQQCSGGVPTAPVVHTTSWIKVCSTATELLVQHLFGGPFSTGG